MKRDRVFSVLLVLLLVIGAANIAYLYAAPPATPANTLDGVGFNVPYVISQTGYSIGANEVISILRAADFTSVDSPEYFLNAVNKTDLLAYPQQDYDYLIYTDGTNYYAKNGTTGLVDYSGTNATAIISSAYNSLTVGRTWKETIVLKGNFTIDTEINPLSYSKTIIQGKISVIAGEVINIINILNAHDVEVIGGELDGNQANTPYGADMTHQTGIWVWDSYNCIVDTVYVHDCWADGIAVRGATSSRDNLIQNCRVDNVGSAAFEALEPSIRTTFINCNGTTVNYPTGFATMAGYEIRSDYNKFINCYAVDCATTGFLLMHTAAHNELLHCSSVNSTGNGFYSIETVSYNLLQDCQSIDSGGLGFKFTATFQFNTLDNCVASGSTLAGFQFYIIDHYNLITNCKTINGQVRGWEIANSLRLQFINCQAYDNSQNGDGVSEGWEITASTDCQFINCRSISTNGALRQDRGFREEGACDRNQWISCVAVGNKNGQIVLLGANNIIHYNTGYVAENSGTATLLNGQTTIAVTHGLSYTPTAKDITITFTELPTNPTTGWMIGTFTSTQFTFTANDPGASNLDFSWHAIRTP